MTLTHGFDSVVTAARLGAEWAWAELYKEVFSHLLAYFKIHGTPSPATAANEVFFDLARELQVFDGDERDFRMLVFGLAYSRSHSLEDRATSRLTKLADRVVARLDDGAVTEPLPAGITRVLAGMDHTQRDIVLLQLLGDLNIDQVASLVGIKRARVRSIQEDTTSILPLPEAVPA